MNVDTGASVASSTNNYSCPSAFTASVIPNTDDENTLSEIVQSVLNGAVYGDLSIAALKQFPGIKLELINQIPKQKYCFFVATSTLARKIVAQSEELGAFSAELIIEPGCLLEYVDLIPDRSFNIDSVITSENKQEFFIYCNQRKMYYNGFDKSNGCGAYFLAYANDPLGVTEPNMYLSYDATNQRLGLYNSKCIRPGMELFWEYDSSGKYWQGRDIYLHSEVWKRVVMKYPTLNRKNRRRIRDDDDTVESQVIGSIEPSNPSPVKRRRLQLVCSNKTAEVTQSPLFARSKFTTKDILECQLQSDLREIKTGILILQKGFGSFMESYQTISASICDTVLNIISHMYKRSNAVVNESFYADLVSSSRALGLINEVSNIYRSFDDMFSTVRRSSQYLDFIAKISSKTTDTLTPDTYDLISKDILTTIKRLWSEMDTLRWKDLVAVDRENKGYLKNIIFFYIVIIIFCRTHDALCFHINGY